MNGFKLIMATWVAGASLTAYGNFFESPYPTSLEEVEAKSFDNAAPCSEQLAAAPYCINHQVDGKDIIIDVYAFISKEELQGAVDEEKAQDILQTYISFEQWPQYIENSDLDYIRSFEFSQAEQLSPLDDGSARYVHSFKYTSKAPLIRSLDVRGTSTYTIFATPKPNALVSAQFQNTEQWGENWELINPLPEGEKTAGIRGQDAVFHIIAPSDNPDVLMLVYKTRVRLKVELALNLASSYVKGAMEEILVGMFYPQQ